MRLRFGRLAALGVAAAAAVAGCSFPPSPVGTVAVTDHAGTITGIPTLRAGQYTFRLSTPSGGLQLVRLSPGYSEGQLLSDVGATFGPPSPSAKVATRRLYSQAHFVGGAFGASSFSAYLIPGSYVAVDPNSQPGRPQAFTVTPRAVGSNFPAADVLFGGAMTMAGGHDAFNWQVLGALKRGGGTLRLTTLDGDEPHFVSLGYIHPGKTAAQCFGYQGSATNPYCDEILATGIVSANETMTTGYPRLRPGTYGIACFMPDPDTGAPHAALGMVRTITVG